MKHVFIAPHPDDAEIGAGGLIHQLRSNGEGVCIAVCAGDGDLHMVHSGQDVSFQQRREEQLEAANRLLNPNIKFLELAPASRFDSVGMVEFVQTFDDLLPHADVVYVPLPSYNADHVRVWDAVRAAMRPGRMDHVKVYAYEQPFGNEPPPWGKTYVQLTHENVGAKCAAIAAHMSQMRGRMGSIYGPHAANMLASLRGKEIGVPYAEAFYLIRSAQLLAR